MSIEIRRAQPTEARQLAIGITCAFADDPLTRWVYGDDDLRTERGEASTLALPL